MMLQNILNNYIEWLKQAFKTVTSLSIENATVADYFKAVGYEFAAISSLIGLVTACVIVIVVVVAGPYIIFNGLLYKPYHKYNDFGMFMHNLPNLKQKDENHWYEVCAKSFSCIKEEKEKLEKIDGGPELYKLLEELHTKTNGFAEEYKNKKDVRELIARIREAETEYQTEEQRTAIFDTAFVYEEIANDIMVAIYVVWVLLLIPLVFMFF